MDPILGNDLLGLVATTSSGAVWRFFAKAEGSEVPIFRAPPAGGKRDPLKAGCFPLVPFANRVRGNSFAFEGCSYGLEPNMTWDRHYLHGDGWTSEWAVVDHSPTALTLGLDREGRGTPYSYAARQSFVLDGATLTMRLAVTNTGATALPFGLGWHPYFPLTPRTTLECATRSYWDEDANWLPTLEHPTAGELDFARGAPLPRRWVDTQFEGWDGRAAITWPEHGLRVTIEADPIFGRALVFVSDPAFDPGYAYDFFCFEPMSHSVDAHHWPDLGGLKRLAPGETLEGSMRMMVTMETRR